MNLRRLCRTHPLICINIIEKDVKEEAVKKVSETFNLPINQMTAVIFKKCKTVTDADKVLQFQNDDTLTADDIQKVEVSYEGEPIWSCGGCRQLEKKLDATQQKLDATQQKLDATQQKVDATRQKLDEFMLAVAKKEEYCEMVVVVGEIV